MRTLPALLMSALILSACQTATPPVLETTAPTVTPTVSDNNAAWDNSTVDNGDFTFVAKPGESAYLIDVLYKGEPVGTITKEVPGDGYNAYLLEETGGKAFIAVNPTGLGGYILYGHAFDVYSYNFANQTFDQLPVTGVDDISPDGNLVAYWTTWDGPDGTTWGPAVYDLSTKTNVSVYTASAEFDEGGHATFSPSGKNLAFELAIKGDTVETHTLFLGAAVGGEFKEMARQESEYFSMDWASNITLQNFEAANQ